MTLLRHVTFCTLRLQTSPLRLLSFLLHPPDTDIHLSLVLKVVSEETGGRLVGSEDTQVCVWDRKTRVGSWTQERKTIRRTV